jgi:hypothetical protein
MSRHVINSENAKAIKLLSKKYGSFEIDTPKIKGVVDIVNYRKYSTHEEVDIILRGKINAIINNTREWLELEDIKKIGVSISKIKLNRFIKKSCIFDITTRMRYFGADIQYYNEIKNVKWV